MGEAKRRRDAYAEAKPYRPPRICPKCGSVRITRLDQTVQLLGAAYDGCRDCGAAWEPYPDDWCEDVVGAMPCDNCAFRPGSPEQQDPEGWKALIDQLRAGQEFRCHKGAPIRLDGDKISFDAEWVKKHGRTCAGFIRMVWAMRRKGENWLDRHLEFCGAPGYDMSLPKDTVDAG